MLEQEEKLKKAQCGERYGGGDALAGACPVRFKLLLFAVGQLYEPKLLSADVYLVVRVETHAVSVDFDAVYPHSAL